MVTYLQFYIVAGLIIDDSSGKLKGLFTLTVKIPFFSKQWIKGSLANFICKTKSLSKQEVLIMITCPSKVLQWIETMLSKLATFPCFHWVVAI